MSQHHKRSKWSNHNAKARARLGALLPQPCSKCGYPVLKDQPWDVDHLVSIAEGGNHSPSNLRVAHRSCNRRAGGKAGRAKQLGQRPNPAPETRLPKW